MVTLGGDGVGHTRWRRGWSHLGVAERETFGAGGMEYKKKEELAFLLLQQPLVLPFRRYWTIPSVFPTFRKASSTRSICSSVCEAM